jgi:hypothetical protein
MLEPGVDINKRMKIYKNNATCQSNCNEKIAKKYIREELTVLIYTYICEVNLPHKLVIIITMFFAFMF